MENYIPPFEITDYILMKVSQICEKVGIISSTMNFDSRLHLRRNNRIRSIYSSLKIEANSLSLDQVRDVINGKLVLGEAKEIQEVKNAYEAYESLLEINTTSIDDLLKYHGILTKYLLNETGKFRSKEEGVFDGETCIFVAPPARYVRELIEQLIQWMGNVQDVLHPLIIACVFHYEFVFIHPFADGNGRMARLWHTAILTKWRDIFAYIPLESQIEKFQNEYYDAISICHKNGSSTVFIEFMLEQLDLILDEVMSKHKDDEALSECEKKLLNVMEYDVPYTRDSLMSRVNIKSIRSFRDNYLVPAMKSGLVQMTIPDKPNSRNQRYIKK